MCKELNFSKIRRKKSSFGYNPKIYAFVKFRPRNGILWGMLSSEFFLFPKFRIFKFWIIPRTSKNSVKLKIRKKDRIK